MSSDATTERVFDGTCPWCTTPATLPIDAKVICESRRCACGAISLGAPARDFDEVLDDALGYFRVPATAAQKNFEPPERWLAASGIQLVEGGVADPVGMPSALRRRHYWFRRSSFLDAPVLSERMFFPQQRWPPAVVAVECAGATLACAAFRPHPDGPVLIHFHGNGETVADYVPAMADAFAAVGLNTFFVEYRGYGASTGTPALVTMLADIDRVLAAVPVPPERVFVYGRSIGSIYAIEAVRRRPALGGLIVESGIADPLERILVRVSPAELGVDDAELRREVARHLDHQAKLAAYPGRVLVLHARHDHLIQLSHAQRNASWSRNGELLVFDHGDHNTVLAYNHAAIVDAVGRFVRG